MVQSGSKGLITGLMTRLGALVRKYEVFTDDEVAELLDVLADDLKGQRPATYVFTDRVVGQPQRCLQLQIAFGDHEPRVLLFNGITETPWGLRPKNFDITSDDHQVDRFDSISLVTFLRAHGRNPEHAYERMVESAVRAVLDKANDYSDRTASLYMMFGNIRTHQSKSSMLSQVIGDIRR